MATNIGNKLSKSGTDLFFATLGMPNTSEGMYKTVTYCDTYIGMESVEGTVNADTTYSKTQDNIVTGSHTFNSTTGLHTNIWIWNDNSNTSGSDAGSITGSFSLDRTFISSVQTFSPSLYTPISDDGDTVYFKPTGLTISTSPNTTSFRYIDEPITVTIGRHESTYDYGGTVSFKTSDAIPKGIAQNFYNQDAPYYILRTTSSASWVTPRYDQVEIYGNSPDALEYTVAKQSLATNPVESLHAVCTSDDKVAYTGGTKTMQFNAWAGVADSYQGFSIPSCSDRTFYLSYQVTVKNSSTTPSNLTGVTTTLTQYGKTASLAYYYTCDENFVTLTNAGGTGSAYNSVDITFASNDGSPQQVNGTIKFSDTSSISVPEYESISSKVGPTAEVTITGYSNTIPLNSTIRTATISYGIKWTNVDVDNTEINSGTYTFTQEGSNYDISDFDKWVQIYVTGSDMSYYPSVKGGIQTNPPFPVTIFEGPTGISVITRIFIGNNTGLNPGNLPLTIQFPYFRPDSIGGSANGSITNIPQAYSSTTSYWKTNQTLNIPLTSNITFVNQNTPAHDSMTWKMRIASFNVTDGVKNNAKVDTTSITLTQAGNEYESSTKTEVSVKGTSNVDWITPSSGIATFNDETSSSTAKFIIAPNNAYVGGTYLRVTSTLMNNIYVTGSSKNTAARSGTITWTVSNSGDGEVTINRDTTTYSQSASNLIGHVDVTWSGDGILNGSYTYTTYYPVIAASSSTTASSYAARIYPVYTYKLRYRDWYNVDDCSVTIPDRITYKDTVWTADLDDMPTYNQAPDLTYTISAKVKDLYYKGIYNVDVSYLVKDYAATDSMWESYISPINTYTSTYTINHLTNSNKYYIAYRYINEYPNGNKQPSDDSELWSSWKIWPKDENNAYLQSVSIEIDSNESTETYNPTCSVNSNVSTLQGGWTYISGGKKATTQRYFWIQTKVCDSTYSDTYTLTSSDYYWQGRDPGSSNGDKIYFAVLDKGNCTVSGNYRTKQAGTAIPTEVTITPIYESGTKTWYKDGAYYGDNTEPGGTIAWTGSICSNRNSLGTKQIPIWENIGQYNVTCGVTGGTATYTKTITVDNDFTKYFTYTYSVTMQPVWLTILGGQYVKTQTGTAQSETETVTAGSTKTTYYRYVSWDNGVTWSTRISRTMGSGDYNLAWVWKYATSNTEDGLYSGSGFYKVTQDTSATMTLTGYPDVTVSDDVTIYVGETATITVSALVGQLSAIETSIGTGQTRTITPTVTVYYSTDNTNWTYGGVGPSYDYTFTAPNSKNENYTQTIYWKIISSASSDYSKAEDIVTSHDPSTITVKIKTTTTTETETITEYKRVGGTRYILSYSGTKPIVTTSGGGNIDYWTTSATVSASSSSSTTITITYRDTWIRQQRTGTRTRTKTVDNSTGTITYSDWSDYTYTEWKNYDTQSSTGSYDVEGSITIQYSTDNSTWTNGSSVSVTPSSSGSSGTTTGTSSTVYFRGVLHYSDNLVETSDSVSASVAKYGVTYYNQ